MRIYFHCTLSCVLTSKYVCYFRVHRDRHITTFYGMIIILKVTSYSVSRTNYVTLMSDVRDPLVYQRLRIMLISQHFGLDIIWSRKSTIGESSYLFLYHIAMKCLVIYAKMLLRFNFNFTAEKDLISRVVVRIGHRVQWREQSQFTPTRSELCTSHNSYELNCHPGRCCYLCEETVYNCDSTS